MKIFSYLLLFRREKESLVSQNLVLQYCLLCLYFKNNKNNTGSVLFYEFIKTDPQKKCKSKEQKESLKNHTHKKP